MTVEQAVNEEKRYFRWLCNRIGIEDYPGKRYFILANDLWCMEWLSINPLDQNREIEALNLRKNYIMNSEADPYVIGDLGVAKVLEVLIAIAGKMVELLADSDINDNTEERWFFEMASNAGLCIMEDERYLEHEGLFVTHEAMERVIERSYRRDGVGGLFPLTKPKNDQRKCELWYQMNQYILEKYAQI